MSAFAFSSAAQGRPFLFPPAGAEALLKKLGSAKLAQVTPASRLEVRPAPAMVSSGIAALDELTGGWPRGCLSEICGPASSGRTGVVLAALAHATRRGEVGVLVDASDALHPGSAAAAGVAMERMLWVRCGRAVASCPLSVASGKSVLSSRFSVPSGGAGRGDSYSRNSDALQFNPEGHVWEARLDQVLKVTDLLLQSNGFGMIVLDLGDVPGHSARRIPLASWFRFRRAVEHTPTVLLVVEQQSIAGNCSSVLVKVPKLSAVSSQLSENRLAHTELLDEFVITVEVVRSRVSRQNGEVRGLGTFGRERKPVQSAASFSSRAMWAGLENPHPHPVQFSY